jgi:hypothetical protein
MSEEIAAQAEEVIDDPRLDTPEVETEAAEPSESAPEDAKPEDKPEDGVQKRINKITADKYTEKRRADDLQRQLDELKDQPKPVDTTAAPKLEDFDFDQDAYNAALIDHKVAQRVSEAVKEVATTQSDATKAAESQKAQQGFNDRIAALAKTDFDEVANSVPLLPEGVADALVRAENGAELIYHLGTHLDLADKVANMSPQQAMMELGRISVTMAATPDVKLSAAPDPIEPLNSGGSVSTDRGPKGATFE